MCFTTQLCWAVIMLKCLAGFLALGLLSGANASKTYQGYQVLETESLGQDGAKALQNLALNGDHYDFWTGIPVAGTKAKIMASPEHLAELEGLLSAAHVAFSTIIPDVQSHIAALAKPDPSKSGPSSPRYAIDWNDYYRFDAISEFVDEMAASNEFVSVQSIGKSFEGRDTKVLSITKAGPGAPNVFFETGMHAREWIGPAVVTYTIKELLENPDMYSDYLDNLNLHFLPVANPDGYEYTFTGERLWRKTRSETGSTLGCMGVDGNRNFAYHFGESGVSDSKCSDVYNGPEPFSEVETSNIRDFTESLDPTPVIAFAFHSAAEILLYPYGFDYDIFPENIDEIVALGDDFIATLNAVNGMTFENIPSTDLYPCAGTSHDWYRGELGSRFAYTLELRDQGYGFLLPSEQIIPSGEETFAGVKVLLDKALEVSSP